MNSGGIDPYSGQMLMMPNYGCESYGTDGSLETDASLREECAHFISEGLSEPIDDLNYVGEVH